MSADPTAGDAAAAPRSGGANARSAHLFYRKDDFLLYAVSLLIVGSVAQLAFESRVVLALLDGCLCFMLIFFVLKHGVSFDGQSLVALGEGIRGYPQRAWRKLSGYWSELLATGGVFLAAVVGEHFFVQRFPGSFLAQPFPFELVVGGMWAAIAVFRTVILVAHLRKAAAVRAVLDGSGWVRQLRGLPTWLHLLQAYITGTITQACAFMPAFVFWRLTEPTWFRETCLLLVGSVVVVRGCAAAMKLVRSTRDSFLHPTILTRFPYSAFVLDLADREEESIVEHDHDHRSRLGFALSHGHHHDALPCGLVGGPGAGFGEALELYALQFSYLYSISLFMVVELIFSIYDIRAHQYIPGVFPYSKRVVGRQVHHVAHHYGALQPLSTNGIYRLDQARGYRPESPITRWFVHKVEEVEGLDAAEASRFLALTDVAVLETILAARSGLGPGASRAP